MKEEDAVGVLKTFDGLGAPGRVADEEVALGVQIALFGLTFSLDDPGTRGGPGGPGGLGGPVGP